MFEKKDFLLGYAPTRRNVFSREDALKYKVKVREKIQKLGYKLVDIEDCATEGLLLSDSDAEKTIKKFKDKNVDAVFSPHCNFGTESATAKVAVGVGKPFLLWGPRDEAPLADGSRLRDTQCGLFATSKILQRFNAPFTYIVNSGMDDEVFARGFENFARAANVVKVFRKIRIGQIGVRPGDFWTVICNEGELLERFGVEIVPFNLGDIVSMAKEMRQKPDEEFNKTYDFVTKNMNVEIEKESLKNIVALKAVMKKIASEQGINAFAIQCWTSLQAMFGILPCLANSLMFDDKIPVACETDINGAISALIAQAATFNENPVFFADLTIRNPEDDNSELLWHCGPFPSSLRKKGEKGSVGCHFVLDGFPPGTCNWEIKGGDVSIIRFDGVNGKYSLFVGEAKGIEGPKTKGTYLWIKAKDWSLWEEKLIMGPYIHHIAGVHGLLSPVLYEASKYINGVCFDPAEPSLDEIKDWLACRKK
jgi:L-fucose isomerase-like protein